MDRVKLLQNPLPIDRVAARVIRPAKPEQMWRPLLKPSPNAVESSDVLRIANIPRAALLNKPELENLPGKRRDRMVIVGYSANQGSPKQQAKWVVRCDCGNYEHRSGIFRWLGTKAPDMCRECNMRSYKLHGPYKSRAPAIRSTVETLKQEL